MSEGYVSVDLKASEMRVLAFLASDAGVQMLRHDPDASEYLTRLGQLLARALGEDDDAEP
jgi:hypothetical protein